MSQPRQVTQEIRTTCCIVGGGPAGMMLGLMLARAGVEVIVLEKHGDFLRDFRLTDVAGVVAKKIIA